MMMWLHGSICLWFLWGLAGCLLPPQNVTVEFQDFNGSVLWLPSADHINNTHYYVEIQEIGGIWQSVKCNNSVIMTCRLDILVHDPFQSYNVRVRAENGGQRSNWTHLKETVQLSTDTVFSAPDLRLWVFNRSLFVELHHPAVEIFQYYNITLLQVKRHHNYTLTSTVGSSSKHVFRLPMDHTYCIIVSAANHQSRYHHMTTQKCIDLTGHIVDTPVWLHVFVVAVGVVLLLTVLIGPICCYLTTTDQLPPALGGVVSSTKRVLILEEVVCPSKVWEDEDDEDEDSLCSYQGYNARVSIAFHHDNTMETDPISSTHHDDSLETLLHIRDQGSDSLFTMNTQTSDQRTSVFTLLSAPFLSLPPSFSSPPSTPLLPTPPLSGYCLAWDNECNLTDNSSLIDYPFKMQSRNYSQRGGGKYMIATTRLHASSASNGRHAETLRWDPSMGGLGTQGDISLMLARTHM
ncbi:hypothetical protein DPEC_G00230770 [Dallia pectoralis]|uniref:Uncharacterized protein n=1 Tax=Dallia pectoralis TaxID=75939 RepID=A0ACC2G236_DALPE|nr:hypothetical protein DPEC_G00230770 [Dallia pectoralis]